MPAIRPIDSPRGRPGGNDFRDRSRSRRRWGRKRPRMARFSRPKPVSPSWNAPNALLYSGVVLRHPGTGAEPQAPPRAPRGAPVPNCHARPTTEGPERGSCEAGRGSPVRGSHRLRTGLPVLQLCRSPRLRWQLWRVHPQLVLPLREPRSRPEQDSPAADRAPSDPAPGPPGARLVDAAATRDLAERIRSTSGRL